MSIKYRDYQKVMREHVIRNEYCGLFAEPGLGKTLTTLSALHHLMRKEFAVWKTLVIAPYNVADSVWSDELEKWGFDLKMVKVMGSSRQRLEALSQDADMYVINVENVPWLVNLYLTAWPFDCVVIDESSMFKSSDTARWRSLSMVRPFMDRVIILTGTPSPNSLADLWPQLYLVDMGERLGSTLLEYQRNYLFPENVGTHRVNKWGITKDNEKRVYKKIGDICISFKEKDYLKLPPLIFQDYKVKLPEKIRKKYDEFERTQVLKFYEEHDEADVTAVNAAVLVNKLIQFAGGSIYDEDSNTINVHSVKLDALAEIIEQANGKPILIAYQYKHQLDRMMKRFGGHLFKKGDVKAWNEGKFKIMYIHPKSGGHGLNLQAGGCRLVWFSPTWSLELFLQMNKRLHRSGQTRPVIIHRLICVGTMDVDCIRAVNNKMKQQDAVMNALKARKDKYIHLLPKRYAA